MKEQDKPNTEQLILKAAEEEFFSKGFAGARTEAIAQKAGVTHAMLHYYFRTKKQLFEHVVAGNFTLLARTMTIAMGNPDMPVIGRLEAGISSHFDFVAAHPQLPRFFMNEVWASPEYKHLCRDKMNEVGNTLFASLQRDVDEAAARGEMEQVDVRMLFISIFSLNIFPVLACQLLEQLSIDLLDGLMGDKEKYFAERKKESVETIMRRIRKQ